MVFIMTVGTLLNSDIVIDNQRNIGGQLEKTVNKLEGQIKSVRSLTSGLVSGVEKANKGAQRFTDRLGFLSASEDFISRTCVEPVISMDDSTISYDYRPL